MKIIYASSSLIPSQSANSIHSMKMCRALARHDHEVLLLARHGDSGIDPFGFYGVDKVFKVVYSPWPNMRLGGLVYGWHTTRFLRDLQGWPDLVYGRSIYGVFAAALIGYPVIYEVHDVPSTARRPIEAWLLMSNHLKRLVTISNSLREEYLRIFPWLRNRVEVIVAPDAADLPSEVEKPLENPEWLGGRPNAPQIGYVGHLYPGKGVELVLEIAKRLPDFDFHLVGGTSSDIAHWKSNTSLSNVYFHGFVPHSEVQRYHSAFDVLLLPCARRVTLAGRGDISRWMSPLKMFEYMASGTVILASDLPVLREVLIDGVNCKLADPDQPDEWAAALKQLVDNRSDAQQLANSATKEFMEKYTWARRAKNVLDGLTSHQT